MKNMKRFSALILSAMLVLLSFAGCSSSEIADTTTDETMLVAYTEENAPFIYEDENGNLTGFDVEILETIFDSVKNDYKNLKFVKVDEDYKIGEDVAETDSEGNEYIAYIMAGGVRTNSGTFNEDCSFTESIISNRVVTVVNSSAGNAVTYADLEGMSAGVVGDTAKTALDKHTTIKNSLASVAEYDNAADALNDLAASKIDAVIIDEFNFNVAENKDVAVEIDGELDTINYVYAFAKNDWVIDNYNEAIYELQSPNYNDADEFTPIVEKYFGYDASSFNYQPSETK